MTIRIFNVNECSNLETWSIKLQQTNKDQLSQLAIGKIPTTQILIAN